MEIQLWVGDPGGKGQTIIQFRTQNFGNAAVAVTCKCNFIPFSIISLSLPLARIPSQPPVICGSKVSKAKQNVLYLIAFNRFFFPEFVQLLFETIKTVILQN